jgi:hypothetical protein
LVDPCTLAVRMQRRAKGENMDPITVVAIVACIIAGLYTVLTPLWARGKLFFPGVVSLIFVWALLIAIAGTIK